MTDKLQDIGRFRPRGAAGGAASLIGRDTEVQALVAAVTGLEGGAGGRAVGVVGEPGIGKSALLSEVVGRARAAGMAVCAVRGRGAGRSSTAGVRRLPGVAELAARAAEGTPLLAALDDLHRVPDDELPAVDHLLEVAGTGPVLCLLAYRQRQVSPALAEVLAHAASAGVLDVWTLPPLAAERAKELLGEHPRADEVVREAMGNPLYLKALSGAEEVRAQAGTAVLGELAGLDADALVVLQAAAVLGEPFRPELVAEVAELDGTATGRALDRLAALDLLRPCEPAALLELRHPALGEILYQQVEPGRRHALHRRAESALAERTAAYATRARHVVRAADPEQPEHVTVLMTAARDVLYSAPAEAVGFLRAALPLLREGQDHWHEAHVLLARAQLLAGDASESRALLDSLRATVAGAPAEATVLPESSRAERRLGRFSEAGALARSGLAALADRDSATAAALHIELADYAYDLQDFDMSRDHAETAAAIARRHLDRVGEAQAMGQAALASLYTRDQDTAQARATAAAELIDASPDGALLTNLDAVLQVGLTEGVLGRLDASQRHLARAAELSRRTGQKHVEHSVLTVLANAQARSGNLRGALATLDESGRRGGGGTEPSAQAIANMLRAEILHWLGDSGSGGSESAGSGPRSGAAEVEAAAGRALAIASGSPAAWAVSVRCFHAELVLHNGDPARARWLLLDAVGGEEDLPRLTVWRKPRWCDTLAEAAHATGDPASVEHWARLAERCHEELPSAGRHGFALRARMRAHAAQGAVDAALRSAEEAMADFTGSGERIELCRTLLAAAALSLDAGRLAGVADWLDRAAYLAEQCGSGRLADDVARHRRRLAGAAAPVRAPEAPAAQLTARERQIADLVSTGLTNSQIAQRLVLSVRTVETHLGQVYRKLGIANRASLTRTMLTGGGGPTPSEPRGT
ncbi:helix-turn-helix transcriptional regulator [Streptacidiphilus melanogenes]|uniref:helix-turn-helix transcriptional regulator n=1 Tax=Streptacidiphilus melanogenes TaxID=411235 RepID=UPI0005A611E7|nr:LuxR family transcriptional regulator [Streptacidiphilus melanogenes]